MGERIYPSGNYATPSTSSTSTPTPSEQTRPHHRHRRIGSSWLVSAVLMGEVVLTEWTSHPVRTHLREKSAVLSVRILSMWSTIQKRIARVQRTIPASWSSPTGLAQYAATSTLTFTTVEGVVTSTPEFATTLVVQVF